MAQNKALYRAEITTAVFFYAEPTLLGRLTPWPHDATAEEHAAYLAECHCSALDEKLAEVAREDGTPFLGSQSAVTRLQRFEEGVSLPHEYHNPVRADLKRSERDHQENR